MIQNYEFTVIFDADEEKMKAGYELVKGRRSRNKGSRLHNQEAG